MIALRQMRQLNVSTFSDHGLKLPRANHRLNAFETDFHWRDGGLVVEVDGFEHHREREPFATDRFRGLVHRARGFEVIRVNADDVYDRAPLVIRALPRRAIAQVITAETRRANLNSAGASLDCVSGTSHRRPRRMSSSASAQR